MTNDSEINQQQSDPWRASKSVFVPSSDSGMYHAREQRRFVLWYQKSLSCLVIHLTHWGRVTHICVSKLTIIGSDNGLSPGRRQAIIWTNAGILFIWPLGTKFNEILIEIRTFSFKKMHLKRSSSKWQPFCLGLNVLTICCYCGFLVNATEHWTITTSSKTTSIQVFLQLILDHKLHRFASFAHILCVLVYTQIYTHAAISGVLCALQNTQPRMSWHSLGS